jgi:hypothetical protein
MCSLYSVPLGSIRKKGLLSTEWKQRSLKGARLAAHCVVQAAVGTPP